MLGSHPSPCGNTSGLLAVVNGSMAAGVCCWLYAVWRMDIGWLAAFWQPARVVGWPRAFGERLRDRVVLSDACFVVGKRLVVGGVDCVPAFCKRLLLAVFGCFLMVRLMFRTCSPGPVGSAAGLGLVGGMRGNLLGRRLS